MLPTADKRLCQFCIAAILCCLALAACEMIAGRAGTSPRRSGLLSVVLILAFGAFFVYGHGTEWEILSSRAVLLKTRFDSGLPMAHARVLVFPPDQTVPACTTETDSLGIFSFTPDQPGTWVLQVRDRGGHGMRINLPVDETHALADSGGSGPGGVQKAIVAMSVLWGFAGTALFFRRGRQRG
jgi:nickel transport protein